MDDFSVTSESKGNAMVVTVSGRVDSVTAATLDADLGKITREQKKVVIDLKDVAYMSSAGVRAIMRALRNAEKSGGSIKLAGVSKMITDVLETVGMLELVQPYPSVDAAVASF